jgi:hypothetical protein
VKVFQLLVAQCYSTAEPGFGVAQRFKRCEKAV